MSDKKGAGDSPTSDISLPSLNSSPAHSDSAEQTKEVTLEETLTEDINSYTVATHHEDVSSPPATEDTIEDASAEKSAADGKFTKIQDKKAYSPVKIEDSMLPQPEDKTLVNEESSTKDLVANFNIIPGVSGTKNNVGKWFNIIPGVSGSGNNTGKWSNIIPGVSGTKNNTGKWFNIIPGVSGAKNNTGKWFNIIPGVPV